MVAHLRIDYLRRRHVNCYVNTKTKGRAYRLLLRSWLCQVGITHALSGPIIINCPFARLPKWVMPKFLNLITYLGKCYVGALLGFALLIFRIFTYILELLYIVIVEFYSISTTIFTNIYCEKIKNLFLLDFIFIKIF